MMRAGVTLSDVDQDARKVLMAHMLDMGLVKGLDVEGLMNKKIDRWSFDAACMGWTWISVGVRWAGHGRGPGRAAWRK